MIPVLYKTGKKINTVGFDDDVLLSASFLKMISVLKNNI